MLLIDANDIKRRAEAVNLSLKAIVRRGGGQPATFYSAVRRAGETKRRTAAPVIDALVAEELRLRDYLIGLHGLPAPRQDEAA